MPSDLESHDPKFLFPDDTLRLNRIRLLVSRPGGMERFRQKCLEWAEERRRRIEKLHLWDRARLKHEARVRREPKLRDEEQRPPRPGWEFVYYRRRMERRRVWRLSDRKETSVLVELEGVEGWTPPRLLLSQRPEYEPPLPFRKRLLTIAEKYIVLSAIYDARFIKCVDLINPWEAQSPPKRKREANRFYAASSAFDDLIKKAVEIPPSEASSFDAMADDVEADLEKAVPSGDADIEREEAKATGPSNSGRSVPDDDSHMSPAQLAKVFRVPADPLRTRLNRWRAQNLMGWIENPDRAPHEPKYVYRVGSVRHIIASLRATSESTSERPPRKK